MNSTWVSLLPPLLVIVVVCVTQQLNISLALGIIVASLIATQWHVIPALLLCAEKGVSHLTDSDNICLYLFLIIISSLVTLLTVTGGAAGCARIIAKKMRTKRSVELLAVGLSFLLSIDDYLSILTVGFVMKPLSDRLAVARTKLAYIMHALAGPLVIIVPISTWAAAILAQLDNAGVHLNAPHVIVADSFYVYVATIPFVFYSFLTLISVLFIVMTRMRYGMIGNDENNAQSIQDESDHMIASQKDGSLIELLLPIFLLLSGVIIGMLYAGNYHAFGGNNSFLDAFKSNNKTFLVLLIAGSISFIASFVLSLSKKMITVSQLPLIVYQGFLAMRSSIMMVILASVLGSFLSSHLHTGTYLASLLIGNVSLCFIPVMLFVVSLIITLTTGSAWGTFSILIPITIEMLISLLQLNIPVTSDQISLLFPSIGAVLSGAACGNHISPFAETTIMTATSAGIGAIEHARSQLGYVIPVIIGTLVSFLAVGLFIENNIKHHLLLSFLIGAIVMELLFVAFHCYYHHNTKKV